MRRILVVAMLLPSLACLAYPAGAAEWMEVGNTPAVRILLDKNSIEPSGRTVRAWLKFAYRKAQSPQTISNGKPFDSSRNQYWVDCGTRKYKVLQVQVYYRSDMVGSFSQDLDMNALEDGASDPHVMSFLPRVCAAAGMDAAAASK